MENKPTYKELEQRVKELEGKFLKHEINNSETPMEKAFYETILNGIVNGVWVTNKDDIIYYTNKGMEIIAGISREQILGSHVLKDFPENTLKYFRPYYLEAKETLRPVYYDSAPVTTPAGRQSYQSGWLIPRINADNFDGMICTVEDCTERKNAQERLQRIHDELERSIDERTTELVKTNRELKQEIEGRKRAEEKLKIFSLVVEQSSNSIVILDLDGKVEYANSKVLEVYKISPDEVIGKHWQSFLSMHSTLRDHIQEICNTVVEKGMIWKGEISDIDESGDIIWREATIFTIKNEKYEIMNVIYMSEDINEHKLAGEALKKEKERFQVLIEESPFGVSLIGRNGLYKYINPKFIEIFGYTLEDISTGRDWFRKAYPDPKYRNQVISTWINDLKESTIGESRPRTFNVRGRNGLNKVIQFRPITLKTGDQIVIYEDTTEKNHLETQLRQAQKMEAMGTLAGGIAHDFNNILGVIIGYSEIMQIFDVPEEGPMKSRLEEVLKAAYRAKDLVQQILTFSRQTEQELKPLQINPIAKEALKFLRASLPSIIEIHQNIDGNVGPVLGDSTQMHQILINLSTNAAQAMNETGGVLEVTLSEFDFDENSPEQFLDLEPGVYIRLAVRDTGHGMAPEVMERIFDPFFTTKKKGEGTGMGLAVVHGIVKSYGGTINVKSKLGEGSIFEVFLPRIMTDVVEPDARTSVQVPTGNECILFVDDEKIVMDLGKGLLEHLGYEVVARTSSIEALEVFRNQPNRFDLVITDMTMPNMTGMELVKELIQIRPDIPVILCTGFSAKLTPEKAAAAGIREFVMKPFGARNLAETVRKALGD
jgi:PAS domain S-box-containing protein